MAKKWGKVDMRAFKDLQKRIEKMDKDREVILEKVVKELATRLLSKVVKRTPVGDYSEKSGINGGTLRRGWTAESERQAELSSAFGGDIGIKKFVESIQVTKKGTGYEIEIVNPVHYASYVEFGHRTRDHKSWVDGRLMLTISERELESQAPAIIDKKIAKFLEEVLNGK